MSEPQRRKSGLSRRSPIAPAEQPTETSTPSAQPTSDGPRRSALASTDPYAPTPTPAPESPADVNLNAKVKLGFYGTEAEAGRIRAAWQHTLTTEDGARSINELNHRAVMDLVEALERKYNGGQQWPYVPPGAIRTGRPVGG